MRLASKCIHKQTFTPIHAKREMSSNHFWSFQSELSKYLCDLFCKHIKMKWVITTAKSNIDAIIMLSMSSLCIVLMWHNMSCATLKNNFHTEKNINFAMCVAPDWTSVTTVCALPHLYWASGDSTEADCTQYLSKAQHSSESYAMRWLSFASTYHCGFVCQPHSVNRDKRT